MNAEIDRYHLNGGGRFPQSAPPAGSQRLLLLLLMSAVFAIVVLGLLIPIAPFLALIPCAMLVLAIAFRMRIALLCAIVIAISAGTYRGVLLSVRLGFAGLPVGLTDVLWTIVFLAVFPVWLKKSARQYRWLPILIVISAVYVAGLGLMFGQLHYDVFKLFRAQALLALGVMIGQSLSLEGHRLVLKGLVVGGALTAISQWATFLFASRGIDIWVRLGVAVTEADERFNPTLANLAGYRDNGVMINFAVLAAIVLLAAYIANYSAFALPFSVFILALCISAVLISLTRSSWLALSAGFIAVAVALGRNASAKYSERMLRLIVVGSFVLSVLLVIAYQTTAGAAIERRFTTSINGTEQYHTVDDRIIETRIALKEAGNMWWIGIGAAEVTVSPGVGGELSVVKVRNQLHNGYVNLLMAGGIFALGVVLLLLGKSIRASWKAAGAASNNRDLFLALAAFGSVIAMALTALTGGVINDAYYTPILGCLCSLPLSWAASVTKPSKSTQNLEIWRLPKGGTDR